MDTHGKPVFNYPELFRAVDGSGCQTCHIILEDDDILGQYCSPECAEHSERCRGCGRGPTWCDCKEDKIEHR